MEAIDVNSQFGGDGTIDSRLTRDTVFVLLDEYAHLALQLEKTFPQGRLVSESSRRGDVLWIAYVVPFQ